MRNMKLHVGNLPFSTTEDELRELLEPHGEVLQLNLVSDRESGRSSGFAFVVMSREEGPVAISALDGHRVGDRRLRVTEARPPQERERVYLGGPRR